MFTAAFLRRKSVLRGSSEMALLSTCKESRHACDELCANVASDAIMLIMTKNSLMLS